MISIIRPDSLRGCLAMGIRPAIYSLFFPLLLALWASNARAFPADFDGDGETDLVLFRGNDHTINNVSYSRWYIMPSSGSCPPLTTAASGGCYFDWGLNGDKPIVGDFDGDGKADYTVRRGIDWYVAFSSGGSVGPITFGSNASTDKIDEADINGDGRSEMIYMSFDQATFNSIIFVRYYITPPPPASPYIQIVPYPTSGAYYVGPGTMYYGAQATNMISTSSRPEPNFYYQSVVDINQKWSRLHWATINTDSGSLAYNEAYSLDVHQNVNSSPVAVVPGNFGGSSLADFNTFRNHNDNFAYWNTQVAGGGSLPELQWGIADDRPVPGNFDWDSVDDYMVWRSSNGFWYLKPSTGWCPKIFCPSNGYTTYCAPYFYGGCYRQWGLPGDIPLDFVPFYVN